MALESVVLKIRQDNAGEVPHGVWCVEVPGRIGSVKTNASAGWLLRAEEPEWPEESALQVAARRREERSPWLSEFACLGPSLAAF